MTEETLRVGLRVRHPYSRTLTDSDNLLATLGSLNTAEVHFNVERAIGHLDGQFSERLVVGGCVLMVVAGLASDGWGSPILTELGLSDLRITCPTYSGDTLSAESEILDLHEDHQGLILTTRIRGFNQRDETVLTFTRRFRFPL